MTTLTGLKQIMISFYQKWGFQGMASRSQTSWFAHLPIHTILNNTNEVNKFMQIMSTDSHTIIYNDRQQTEFLPSQIFTPFKVSPVRAMLEPSAIILW